MNCLLQNQNKPQVLSSELSLESKINDLVSEFQDFKLNLCKKMNTELKYVYMVKGFMGHSLINIYKKMQYLTIQ